MSKRQQRRAEVLGRLSAGVMSKDEAGALLGLSRHQVDRARKKYTGDGISSVVHENDGIVAVYRGVVCPSADMGKPQKHIFSAIL
ncbi:MAG: helix-turn-helix domain-containing protein [Armatimonadetes bacterium]|nr:helix-turn-helix domain-containing protein [Armatimonadota bacterium]